MFGQKFATTNYGLRRDRQGLDRRFHRCRILNIIAAVMATLVLRPLRRKQIKRGCFARVSRSTSAQLP
jgi:hypothetical protein